MDTKDLLDSLTDAELRFIAEGDYGVDADLHLDELVKLLREQDGVLSEGQYWYPYEVVELGAHSLKPGHAREFAACTLLVIDAVATGYDTSTRLDWKFDERASDYDRLPTPLRDLVLDAYLGVGLGNTDLPSA
ncbi:hypothetical protein JI752_009595 [Lysobacter sp. MMG2]|uniref:hypothetical protein n=1 Tax=Lysobacter sp. MMG2 TaxID=2801338 RepID=UPI001C23C21F|nr:hypothetical protein [Lysobacter sp. MMG2]MBU8976390.1 hypothetical protein [Lysobacter sp. MMG2]